MTPAPNDLIASVRNLLRDVVATELQTDVARARLRQVMALLRDVDWNDAALVLWRENTALADLLTRWGAQPSPQTDIVLRYESLASRNAELRALLAGCIAAMPDGWTRNHAEAAKVLAACAGERSKGR